MFEKIQNNPNLDGYIIKQNDYDTLNIYLKDLDKFIQPDNIEEDFWNSEFLSTNNSTNIELLYTYKICHWFIDENFIICN